MTIKHSCPSLGKAVVLPRCKMHNRDSRLGLQALLLMFFSVGSTVGLPSAPHLTDASEGGQ